MTTTIDTDELVKQTALVLTEGNDLHIGNDDQLNAAGQLLTKIKGVLKAIDMTFNEPIRKAYEAHRAMIAAKKKHAEPLLAGEKIMKRKIADYQDRQRKIREEQERELREAARKLEEERRLAQAEELEKQGRAAEAEALIEKPVTAPVVALPEAAKPEGVSTREVWKWRVVDPDLVPRAYLVIDEKALNGIARSLGKKAKVEGIEFYPETVVAARASQ